METGGHEEYQTTMGYTHIRLAEKLEAVNKLWVVVASSSKSSSTVMILWHILEQLRKRKNPQGVENTKKISIHKHYGVWRSLVSRLVRERAENPVIST